MNGALPALFRMVALSGVRLDEVCDVVLCHRANVKYDIVVFEIRVHDTAVVHMRKTMQGMQQDHFASGKGKVF